MEHKQVIVIGAQEVTLADVVAVARHRSKVVLTESASQKITECRLLVEKFIREERTIYGVNTGLGDLCKVRLSAEESALLSKRVIMSHACGVGEPLPEEMVRAIMFAQVLNFSRGHSGVRLEVVDTLIQMLNRGVTPWVPSQGSVGYLTHMAHIALVAIGLGQAYYQGSLRSGKEAMEGAGIPLLTLQEKEGLSLVNGTVCMTGMAALIVHDAQRLAKWADIAGAMSFEALRGTYYAFDERVMQARPYPGQKKVAQNLLSLIKGSEVAKKYKDHHLQDALSIRSMPQIHGACRDKIKHAEQIVTIELQSATDNPLIFADETDGVAISACNAHGEPLALTLDMLSMAIAELANVSERRLDRLVNPHVSELPAFLVEKNGLNSGFMIPQYVAASLVAENKVLAHPISVDSIPTSGNQEDHVSMGTPAALKAIKILQNAQKVIAIELLAAAQGLEFHKPLRLGEGTGLIYQWIRQRIPAWWEDRIFYPELHEMIAIVEDGSWLEQVEARVGGL